MTSQADPLPGALRDHGAEARLARTLAGCRIGHPVHAFAAVGSTMEAAHALAADGAPDGTLVVAARQEQGRGRRGRAWVSPDGGLYCSFILRPQRPPSDLPQLSLVAGLAAAEAVRDAACLSPMIRWPNDLLLGDRKLAGILTEQKVPGTFGDRQGAVVVGVGINVSTDPAMLPDHSTSLAAAGVGHVSPDDVLSRLCSRLAAWYDVWTSQGFGPVRDALRPWIGLFGRPVHLTAGTRQLDGTAQDIDEQGRLVVRLDSGLTRAFDAGEITVLRSA